MDTLDILRKLRCVLVWGLRQCNVLTRFWHWVSRAIYSLFIYIYIFLNISLVSCSHTHTRTHSHTRRQTDWYYRSISFTVINEHNTLRKHVNGAFSYFYLSISSLTQIGNGNKSEYEYDKRILNAILDPNKNRKVQKIAVRAKINEQKTENKNSTRKMSQIRLRN